MGRGKCLIGLSVLAAGAGAYQAGKGVVAEKAYDTGFAKVELLGVCKATEESVGCWGPKGEPAPDLEDDFKNGFLRSDYVNFPIRYGQKTRVAVFRITNPPYNDPRGTIDGYFQTNRGSFDWPQKNSNSGEGERVEIRATVISGKLTESMGEATTFIRRTAPASKRLAMKEGASMDYLGSKFTLRKIIKAKVDATAFGFEQANRWTVALTAQEKEGLPPTLAWVAVDHDGLVIRAVDKDGNPLPLDPNTSPYSGLVGPGGRTNVPRIFPAQFGANMSMAPNMGDDLPIQTNINPSKIKEFFAVGSSSEKLTITGIPLDPVK